MFGVSILRKSLFSLPFIVKIKKHFEFTSTNEGYTGEINALNTGLKPRYLKLSNKFFPIATFNNS